MNALHEEPDPSPGTLGNDSPPPVQPSKSLLDVAFPTSAGVVFFSALGAGALLSLAAVIRQAPFLMNGTQSDLILCAGVAIILAAFGGRANVQFSGIAMAGAAGIALGFFLVLQWDSKSQYLRGVITNVDLNRYGNPVLDASFLKPLVDAKHVDKAKFEFTIFKADLNTPSIELIITHVQGTNAIDGDFRISRSNLDPAFGRKEELEWDLQERKIKGQAQPVLVIFDRSANAIVAQSPEDEDVASLGPSWIGQLTPRHFALVSSASAHAAHEEGGLGGGATDDGEIELLVNEVMSENDTVRHAARDALTAASENKLPAISRALEQNSGNYRARLAIITALAQRLRNDPAQGHAIGNSLSPAARLIIVNAVGDPSHLVRGSAVDLLTHLNDPDIARLAVSKSLTTDDGRAIYNLLFTAAHGGWNGLPPCERVAFAGALSRRMSGWDDRNKETASVLLRNQGVCAANASVAGH